MTNVIRSRRVIPVLLWMLLIFGLSSRSHYDAPGGFSVDALAVIAHLFLYGVLAALMWLAVRHVWPVNDARTFAVVVLLTTLYGVTDEVHQAFVPLRDASLFDVGVDFCSALIVTTALVIANRLFRVGREV